MPSETRPMMDARTLDVLDFDAIRALVARETLTERAAARARAMIPVPDLDFVRLEQAATVEMRRIVSDDPFDLPRTRDVSEAIERAARGSTLAAEDLRDIGIALAAADAAVRRVRASKTPVLHARCENANPLPEVAAAIDRAIGERGEVLDRASPALARLRRNVAHAQDEARERLQSVLRAPKYARAIQEAVVTIREGRFVVPVKAEFQSQLPGVVHDTSSTGHTLFVEPLDALDVNNRVRTLRLEEEREVARILAELSSLVGSRAEKASTNLDVLAEIDFVLARVRVAQKMDAVPPVVLDQARLEIRSGRHPLLSGIAIPQSVLLDDKTRLIVISGPNMGGKTVALKLAGLFIAMTYCGMQVPGDEGTAVGGFDYVGCDIGDEQSIAQNASTFSAHLRRLRELVAASGKKSLVLVDEIASGTEPGAGAALAVAILEDLLARGARGIVTTHSTELKLFAANTPGVVNASVRFDPENYEPTYELDLGSPGQSLAFPLARRMGLDETIVARAESLQSSSERDYDRALEELSQVRAEAASERDRLRGERQRLSQLEATAAERSAALDRERKTLARQVDERLTRALREFTQELERRSADRPGRAKVTSGQAKLLGSVLDDVHRDLGIDGKPKPEPAKPGERPAKPTIAIGDRVHVVSLGSDGEVADDYGDTVLVAIGAMKTVVPKRELRPIGRSEINREQRAERKRSEAKTGAATMETAATARAELDVRGRRFVEAEPLVDKWIDESALLGLSPLRLIHGKGTGLLGRGLQEWLKTRSGVRDVRYGNDSEGGGGVTMFELG